MEHTEARPSWDCRACGKPWPCDPAREQLATAMTMTELRTAMWIRLEEAALELPPGPATELFERFLRWAG
ncbi:hypothetical protein Asi03nite_18460 [Actinoplanes siamensis]|uniref:Flavin reductase n=1 Tax=Actinoplanes siamensis TaxID=1223317 RepID=A0A919N4N3_9ACTN|nr:hypothetical protein [Actinoplanes siamensis]GIF04308.1 hypothetical protein Asi03nite_18460 [Actinoplanes siamensis]